MCDMTHWYVWHDSFHVHCMYVTWFIHLCDMTHSYVWYESLHRFEQQLCTPWAFTCVTWLFYMCDTTPSYVWLHSCHMCDMTHFMCIACVWHDSLICVTCLIHMCNMTHRTGSSSSSVLPGLSHVWHDSLICLWHDSFECVTWLISQVRAAALYSLGNYMRQERDAGSDSIGIRQYIHRNTYRYTYEYTYTYTYEYTYTYTYTYTYMYMYMYICTYIYTYT